MAIVSPLPTLSVNVTVTVGSQSRCPARSNVTVAPPKVPVDDVLDVAGLEGTVVGPRLRLP